jgi:hypothetical protein
VFLCLPGFGESAFAGEDDVADAEVVQGVVDTGFAVAAVRGYGAGFAAGAPGHPLDRRLHPWSVGGGCRAARRGRGRHRRRCKQLGPCGRTRPACRAGPSGSAGVRAVQADPPGRPVRGDPASRCRAWAAIRRVASSSPSRSLTAPGQATPTPTRDRVRPAVELRHGSGFPRRPFRVGQQPTGSSASVSARSASSALAFFTAAGASSRPTATRDRSFDAIACARFPQRGLDPAAAS